ncbi:MAG: hypothetical protein AAFP22_07105, partial [Planctomycetota bacterium]
MSQTQTDPAILELRRALGYDVAGPSLRAFDKVPASELAEFRERMGRERGILEGLRPRAAYTPFVGRAFDRNSQDAGVEGARAMELGQDTTSSQRDVLALIEETQRPGSIGHDIAVGIWRSVQFGVELYAGGPAANAAARGAMSAKALGRFAAVQTAKAQLAKRAFVSRVSKVMGAN